MERTKRTRGDDSGSSTSGGSSVGKRAPTDGLRAPVQAKSEKASAEAPTTDPSAVAGSGAPLDPGVSSGMGAHMGADFSNVKVHQGGAVDGALEGAGARAMAQGNDLYFKSGEYNPGSPAGRELIGHELAHVKQQRDGQTSGLNAKDADGGARNSLESDADQKGAAAAKAIDGPFDWANVDAAAYDAEIKRREASGEPVPIGETVAEVRATPLAREIAGKCVKSAKAAAPAAAGPAQHKRMRNVGLFGGTYNMVEVEGLEGKKFIEQGKGSTASYNLGQHLNASASGSNSIRDGNFGVVLGGQKWNWDSFKGARWDLAVQLKNSGLGTKTLSMHNWAFSNIEVSEDFEVVDPGTAEPGSFSGDIHATDQKMPIVLTGDHVTQKVVHSEAFKNSSGWSIGREIIDSTTMTRSMSLGFSVGLENAAKDKAGSDIGLSSSNSNTIISKVATLGGTTTSNAAATAGETVVTGVKGKTIRKYVYPVFSVKNYKVTAYSHDPNTGEVTSKDQKTFGISHASLSRVETVDANNEEGAVNHPHKPNAGQNAEDIRLEKEKEGKEIGVVAGSSIKIALDHELDAQKDYDKQDFSQVLTEGEKSRAVRKEWTTETVNKFDVINSGGQKVSGTGGWSLGSEGKYAGVGAKMGYSEAESTAGEFGDQVVNTGTNGQAIAVKVDQEVTGPEKGSGKNIQAITMPLFRERVYNYFAKEDTGSWSTLPMKGRSRYYYPVGAVTTKEVPPQTELKPEGHGKLDASDKDGNVKDAKDIKSKLDATPDGPEKDKLKLELEATLTKNREAMEDVARRAHPSLEVIDRGKNLYEIDLMVPASDSDKKGGVTSTTMKKYRSTIEGLLDFTAPSVAAHNAADAMKTEDKPGDGVTMTSTPGLGGTGAQGGVNPFPGDVDMAESIKIVAPSADAAAHAMAQAIQATVTKATAPRKDSKLGYTFHGCMVGVLPPDAKKPGQAAKFTAQQTMAGEGSIEYDKDPKQGGGKGTLTLAAAIANPASNRSVNTYWRGPIDEMGTYGEITKVLNYDAVKQGAEEEHLFGTPTVGQSFQEVGFGGEGRHDTNRANLLAALGPDIAKYAKEGNWVKAAKRCYTVARMLNDVKALNLLEPILGSDVSQLKQLVDHIEMFANDVVNPKIDSKLQGGIGESMNDAQASAEAEMLKARMGGIDGAKEYADNMQVAITAAAGNMARNNKAYVIIEKQIVEPLTAKIKQDNKFNDQAQQAIIDSGYLNPPK